MVGTSEKSVSRFCPPWTSTRTKFFFKPRATRFTQESLFGDRVTLDFSSFDGHLDIAIPRIAQHDMKLRSEGFLQKLREVMTRRARARCAAPRRLRRLLNVFDTPIGRIRTHRQNFEIAHRRADPAEPRPIELHFFNSHQLIEVESTGDHS